MLFSDLGALDFIQQNLTLFSAAMSAVFLTFTGFCAWIGNEVWKKVDKYLAARAEANILKAHEDAKAIKALTETLPKIAENGAKLTALTETNCRGLSDIVKTQVGLHGAFIDLADCLEINACPETRERFKQDLQRVKNRVKETDKPHRPDAPPGFIEGLPSH